MSELTERIAELEAEVERLRGKCDDLRKRLNRWGRDRQATRHEQARVASVMCRKIKRIAKLKGLLSVMLSEIEGGYFTDRAGWGPRIRAALKEGDDG